MKKFTKLCVAACALLAGTAAFADDHVWKFVTAGDATTYAIRNDGTLWAWGWNEKGQTGNSISERSAVPTLTDASRAWKKVVGGKAYGFFLAEDGSLWAAGTQEQGVQGVGDGMDHKVLTRIGTDNDWADMTCSRFWGYSGFAIKTNGTLWAWGDNSENLLGFNTSSHEETTSEGNPVDVIDESEVAEPRQVTAIEGKVFALSGCENTLSVGTGNEGVIDKIWMLGTNTDGALGDGEGLGNGSKNIPFATVPVHPSLRSGLQFSGMSSGQIYTMVLTTEGDIWGWGCNRGGQLGDETRDDQLQVAYEVKPTLINCPQDEVEMSVADVKGKAAAAVAFDGQTLSVQADGRLTSAVVYGMDGQAVMILPVSASSWNVSALSAGVYAARFVVDGAAMAYKFAVK